jgi:hypothetical protein
VPGGLDEKKRAVRGQRDKLWMCAGLGAVAVSWVVGDKGFGERRREGD